MQLLSYSKAKTVTNNKNGKETSGAIKLRQGVNLKQSLFFFESCNRIVKLAVVLQHRSNIFNFTQRNRCKFKKARFILLNLMHHQKSFVETPDELT
jgi:hypothetical protein